MIDFESPIEELLTAALWWNLSRRGVPTQLRRAGATLASNAMPGELTVVTLQAPLARYRIDLLVERAGRRIAVECDGHAFHERTAEQAEHDRKRDRFFASVGLIVLRFTGREVNRSPSKCAAEVLSILGVAQAQAVSEAAAPMQPRLERADRQAEQDAAAVARAMRRKNLAAKFKRGG